MDTQLQPIAIAFDAWMNLYIADSYNNRILKIDNETKFVLTILHLADSSGLLAILIDDAGRVIFSDKSYVRQVVLGKGQVDPIIVAGTGVTGTCSSTFISPLSCPVNIVSALAMDINDNLYFTDTQSHCVR